MILSSSSLSSSLEAASFKNLFATACLHRQQFLQYHSTVRLMRQRTCLSSSLSLISSSSSSELSSSLSLSSLFKNMEALDFCCFFWAASFLSCRSPSEPERMDSSESEPEEDSESEPWSFAKKDIAGGLWSIDVETVTYFFCIFGCLRWNESSEDNGALSAIPQNAETPHRAPYYLLVALVLFGRDFRRSFNAYLLLLSTLP